MSAADAGTVVHSPSEEIQARDLLDEHLFSNTMLDNILGPVAFYTLRGRELDVVRYNRKFLEEIKIPGFRDHLFSIQQLVYEEDLPLFYELFEQAEANRQSGAIGVIRFNRLDGTLLQFRFHLYYSRTDENGKQFYSTVHDLAQFITLDDYTRILSQAFVGSVVFLRRNGLDWSFQVVVHGLERLLGLSLSEFEHELNAGLFAKRMDVQMQRHIDQLVRNAQLQQEYFSEPFSVTGANGEVLVLQARVIRVQDEHSDVNYVMTLQHRPAA